MARDLTDRELAAIKPPKAGRIEVRVAEGLVLRVTAAGARTFGCWWRIPPRFGGPERKGFTTFGSYPGTTLAAAKEQATEVLTIARQGLAPAPELKRRAEAKRLDEEARTALTVRAVVERHLAARRARLRPSTLDQYDRTLKVLKESPLAARPLAGVKRGEVREALRAIGREHAMGTARKVKTLVRAASRWAAAEDLIPHDVLAGLSFAEAEPRVRDRWLSDDEIAALWRACEDVPAIMAASVRLQLILALRHPSETTGMQWADLHENELDGIGKVLVYDLPGERRKHGIPLSLPLPPLAVEVVDGLRPFTGKAAAVLDGWTLGRELHWWRRTIKPAVVSATGAANFTRHDLRRTVASGMTRIGVPVHAADTVLGHVIRGSGRSYIHGARLLEAAGALWKWDAHLQRVLGRPQSNVVQFVKA
jgi:integrase